MIRAVIDTNGLASGLLRANPMAAPARLIDAWRAGRYVLIISEYILDEELPRTLANSYFSNRLPRAEIENFLTLLSEDAVLTPITVAVDGVATHPEDDRILATAVSGGADYLVTGDRKLQRLGAYKGVTIVSPRQFLDRLDEQQSGESPGSTPLDGRGDASS